MRSLSTSALELVLGAVHEDVRPGHEDGALGLLDQTSDVVDVHGMGLARPLRHLELTRAEQHVEWEIQKAGAPARGQCLLRGVRDRLGNVAEVVNGSSRSQWVDEGDVVDLLERALPPPEGRRTAGQRENGGLVELRLGESAHGVGDAGTRGHSADTQRARQPGPALRGERGALLVPHVDEADLVGLRAVEDRKDVTTGQGEDVAHTERLERVRDRQSPVSLVWSIHGSRTIHG